MAEESAAVYSFSLEGLTTELVLAAYRAKAKDAHPDAGGSAEAFAAVDRAKYVLLSWLERQARDGAGAVPHGGVTKCQRCDGKGYVELLTRSFGGRLRKQCPGCHGNGELYDERPPESNRNG